MLDKLYWHGRILETFVSTTVREWSDPMTLTQRLTRAGATFIVFGIAAAVLPQQNGAAQATTASGLCGTTTVQYRLTKDSGGQTDSGTTTSVVSTTPITLYSFYSIGGSFLAAEPTTTYSFSPLNATTLPVFNSSGASTTFTLAVPGRVTANIHAYGSTHIVTYDFTII